MKEQVMSEPQPPVSHEAEPSGIRMALVGHRARDRTFKQGITNNASHRLIEFISLFKSLS